MRINDISEVDLISYLKCNDEIKQFIIKHFNKKHYKKFFNNDPKQLLLLKCVEFNNLSESDKETFKRLLKGCVDNFKDFDNDEFFELMKLRKILYSKTRLFVDTFKEMII